MLSCGLNESGSENHSPSGVGSPPGSLLNKRKKGNTPRQFILGKSDSEDKEPESIDSNRKINSGSENHSGSGESQELVGHTQVTGVNPVRTKEPEDFTLLSCGLNESGSEFRLKDEREKLKKQSIENINKGHYPQFNNGILYNLSVIEEQDKEFIRRLKEEINLRLGDDLTDTDHFFDLIDKLSGDLK